MSEMYVNIVNLDTVSEEAKEILAHVQAIKDLQEKLQSYRGGISVSIRFEETDGRP